MNVVVRLISVLALVAVIELAPRAAVVGPQAGQAIARAEVVVTDRNGRLVRDLKASDFTMLQNGEPQTMTDFTEVSIPVGDRDIDDVASEAPVEATTADPAENDRAFILLVDELHVSTAPDTRRRIELLITDTLRALTPNDDVAILATTETARGYPLNRSLAAQLEALAQLRIDLRLENGRTDWNDDMIASLGAVDDAVDALSGILHARRALVIITTGLNLQQHASDPRLGPVMNALARVNQKARVAGVALYTLDPRGYIGVSVSAADTAFVDRLVAGTGGRVFYNENDARAVPKKLVEENGSFYVLEYRLAATSQRQLAFGMKDSSLQARVTFRP